MTRVDAARNRAKVLAAAESVLDERGPAARMDEIAEFSGLGPFLTELYPTRLRGSGQGFCYNFGRGIGALFPFLVGTLSNSTGLGNAIAIFAVAAFCLFFLAAFALPETRGRVLHAEA